MSVAGNSHAAAGTPGSGAGQGASASHGAGDGAGPGAGGGGGGGHANGSAEHLVKMANDIGNFFRAEPQREDAIAGIANHIAKFWTRRMREKLAAHLQGGDAGLDELPSEALRRLGAPQPAPAAKPAPSSSPSP